MIYFMQSTEGGPVKIGYTSNLERRHKQLETHYQKSLSVLATLEGDESREREIHDQFAHLRLGEDGRPGKKVEQFRPALELMEFIGRPLFVTPNPQTVEAMPAIGGRVRVAVTNVRSVPEWKEWLSRFADAQRKDVSDLVDEALMRMARAEGFELPPKR